MRITESLSSSNKSFLVDDVSIELVPGPVAASAASESGEAEVEGASLAAPGERTVALRTKERGRIEPGVYFYRVDAGEGSLKRRCVILE